MHTSNRSLEDLDAAGCGMLQAQEDVEDVDAAGPGTSL